MTRDVARPLRGLKRLALLARSTCSKSMRDAVQKDRDPLETRTIFETTFRARTSHSVFHSKGNSLFATEFHFSIMLNENELCSALKSASHVYRLVRKPRASGWLVRFYHMNTVGTASHPDSLSLDEIFASHFSLSHSPLRFVTSHTRFGLTSVRKTKHLRRR